MNKYFVDFNYFVSDKSKKYQAMYKGFKALHKTMLDGEHPVENFDKAATNFISELNKQFQRGKPYSCGMHDCKFSDVYRFKVLGGNGLIIMTVTLRKMTKAYNDGQAIQEELFKAFQEEEQA